MSKLLVELCHMKKVGKLVKTDLINCSFAPYDRKGERLESLLAVLFKIGIKSSTFWLCGAKRRAQISKGERSLGTTKQRSQNLQLICWHIDGHNQGLFIVIS